jgi:hypothetical protein
MEIDTNTIIIIGSSLAVLFLILAIWIIRIQSRLNRLVIGKGSQNIEDSLKVLLGDMKDLRQFTKEMEEYLTTVETRLKKSIQGVETVRYNPFKGTGSGGNNSFSTAFLNEKGTGVVLTSMYARDRVSMFAKPVKEFVSEYELSEEEQESITSCKAKLQQTP